MGNIAIKKENGVAEITLKRPEKFNSFIRSMALDLQKVLDDCRDDDSIRCILLTGEGRAFCAGQDLGEASDPNGPAIQKIVSEHYNPIVDRLRKLPKPIISAVNGVAAGAGANIALACDVVLAAESASFIQAFSKIGLIPDSGGTWTLPRLIGFQKASALMMTGEKVSATEAERIGMIYKVIVDAELMNEARAMAATFAQMPTMAFALTKQALNHSWGNDLNTQLDLEDELQTKAGSSEDYKEGVAAFLEKRKPVFKGK
jgi:2-(1,2-epoxy-1,2-dihydrophenyl)acetyl-CoA isomerase